MSRHHPALAVVVRVTATLPHLTVVRVRQLSRKAQSCAPFLWCCNLSERPSCSKQPESVGPVCSAVWSNPIVIPNQRDKEKSKQLDDYACSPITYTTHMTVFWVTPFILCNFSVLMQVIQHPYCGSRWYIVTYQPLRPLQYAKLSVQQTTLSLLTKGRRLKVQFPQ